jgi:hypothetical protein
MDKPYNVRILKVCNFESNMAAMKQAVIRKDRCLFIQEHNNQLGSLNMNLSMRSRSVQEMIY